MTEQDLVGKLRSFVEKVETTAPGSSKRHGKNELRTVTLMDEAADKLTEARKALAAVVDTCFPVEREPTPKPKLQHVCGLQGFCRGMNSEDDYCPACQPELATEADWERARIKDVDPTVYYTVPQEAIHKVHEALVQIDIRTEE